MKRFLTILAVLLPLALPGQNKEEIKYVDAQELMTINQAFDNTATDYSRLPEDMKPYLRQVLWDEGIHSAGVAVRFSSNSTAIHIRWTLHNNGGMSHMAATGVKGIDLYTLDKKGEWRFIGTAKPSGKESEASAVKNMDGSMREYMAYLPLYDGATKVEIGVDPSSTIGKPQNPSLTKGADLPIVFYGTSITQGGCACRPGMVYTSIVSRALNKECINLGFSGNAHLDKSMAEIISRIDAKDYVIDCLPNCTTKMVQDSAYNFITYIAKKHPATPIYMVEHIDYAEMQVDLKCQEKIRDLNQTWLQLYKQLRKEGYRNVKYIPAKGLVGSDFESSVDGCHQTDLGFLRMAEGFLKYLKK